MDKERRDDKESVKVNANGEVRCCRCEKLMKYYQAAPAPPWFHHAIDCLRDSNIK